MELLLATHNAHKTREFAQLLGDEFEISDLSQTPDRAAVVETGKTFAENAILKAVTASKDRPAVASLLVIADDSGLEVDALEGAPGIYSARFAGENASDEQNVEKLLRELAARKQSGADRSARFRCVIALAREGKLLNTFEGTADGVIVDRPRGKLGFGYDPIFVPKGYDQTFGELSAQVKNQISHRAEATRKLRDCFAARSPSWPH